MTWENTSDTPVGLKRLRQKTIQCDADAVIINMCVNFRSLELYMYGTYTKQKIYTEIDDNSAHTDHKRIQPLTLPE